MGVALRAVADDGDFFGLDQSEICGVVVVEICHFVLLGPVCGRELQFLKDSYSKPSARCLGTARRPEPGGNRSLAITSRWPVRRKPSRRLADEAGLRHESCLCGRCAPFPERRKDGGLRGGR